MQPDHAVIVPPGGGVRFGNVEFLGLSEHSPRVNVSVITMAPGRTGPDSHVHQDEDDVFYVLDGELTFLLGPPTCRRRRGRSCSCRPASSTPSPTARRRPCGSSTSTPRRASTSGSWGTDR